MSLPIPVDLFPQFLLIPEGLFLNHGIFVLLAVGSGFYMSGIYEHHRFVYLGDIRPNERTFKRNTQYAKALDELVKAGDALTDGLTEEQKGLFEDYMTAQREINVLTDCETFCIAFKLGAKIMIDVLTEGTMREI